MGKCLCVVALVGLLSGSIAWGQQTVPAVSSEQRQPGPFSLGIAGAFFIPIADAARSFGLGGGEEVSLGYRIPGTVLTALGGLGYALAPGYAAAPTVVFAAAELGLGARFPLTSFLDVFAYGTAGYWYGTFYDMSVSSTDPCAGVGVELQLAFSPTFSLCLGAQYKFYFGLWQGLVSGLGMRIGFAR